MLITSFKRPLLLSVYFILTISLFKCSSKNKHKEKQLHNHHMHMANMEVVLDADMPIFKPSQRSYSNFLKVNNVVNIYLRQNTSLKNKAKLLVFYKEKLQKNGWAINQARSTVQKFVLTKDNRHATIRIFEMKQGDSVSLAFSINLLRPISREDDSMMQGMNQDHIGKYSNAKEPIRCSL